jgi:hypothetical protein
MPRLLNIRECVSSKSAVKCSESTRTTSRAFRAQVRSKHFPLALLLLHIAHHHRAAISAIAPASQGARNIKI